MNSKTLLISLTHMISWLMADEGEKNQLGAVITMAVRQGFLPPTNLRFK